MDPDRVDRLARALAAMIGRGGPSLAGVYQLHGALSEAAPQSRVDFFPDALSRCGTVRASVTLAETGWVTAASMTRAECTGAPLTLLIREATPA